MKRFIVSLTILVCAISPAMSQDLLSTLFGFPQAAQVQPAQPGSGYYGRPLRRMGRAILGPMADLITSTANRYGVPPALVQAVARKESGGRCIGGRGIMQVNPRTAASLGVHGRSCGANLAAGVLYLKQAITMHGYGCAAFSAYQSGLGVHRCSAYGRSIMAMMHGGSGETRVASYRHHRMVRFASYHHHHRMVRYATRHRHHYAHYASR